MNTTHISISLSVRGAIRMLQAQRSQKTYMRFDDGRPMNKAQAIDALMDELAQGRETLPMGSKCGNPCGHAGCKGFDYGPNGGCPGYSVQDEAAAS